MRRPWLALLACALLAAGCSGVQTSLDPAGDQAQAIHGLWDLMLWVCGFMYLLVMGGLAWALWRARGKLSGASPQTEGSPHEGRMGRTLAAWTGLITLGLFVLVTGSFLVDRSLAQAQAGPPLKIKVTANQWWWSIEYPDEAEPAQGFVTANELHLPVGRTAEIELASNDVIHSFWVPNLHGKLDLIPGHTNVIRLTPRRQGWFRGQCAEFCGLEHAKMALQVMVQSPAAYQTWHQGQVQPAVMPVGGEAAAGAQVFASHACALCHAIRGTDAGGQTAPDLTHLAARKTLAAGTLPQARGALAGWIADPQANKPGVNMPQVALTPDQLNALVTYLETLR